MYANNHGQVFSYLESVLPGKVPWNFEKYLVGKDGVPVKKTGVRSFFSLCARARTCAFSVCCDVCYDVRV